MTASHETHQKEPLNGGLLEFLFYLLAIRRNMRIRQRQAKVEGIVSLGFALHALFVTSCIQNSYFEPVVLATDNVVLPAVDKINGTSPQLLRDSNWQQ